MENEKSIHNTQPDFSMEDLFHGSGISDSHAAHTMGAPNQAPSPILVSAHKIAIAGLGLIGGSIAKRLIEHHRFVTAWNHQPHPYEHARALGIHCVDTLEELVTGKPDVLILAVPLESMPAVLEKIAPLLHRGTTLTDVGSVKGPVRDYVKEAGLNDFYIGAHPMAGNEKSGFEASSVELLDGALWSLTFDEKTDYSRFLTVADMVTKGLGNSMIAVDDVTHDHAAALISHMPHVVSTAMSNELVSGNFADPAVAVALSAGSWRDMSRVSLTDPERTRAMVELDAANVATLLDSIAARLTQQAQILRGELEKDPESFAQSRSFYAAAQPFRDYKKAVSQMSEGVEETLIALTDQTWQADLSASATRGERITEFPTTHEARVQQYPSISAAS